MRGPTYDLRHPAVTGGRLALVVAVGLVGVLSGGCSGDDRPASTPAPVTPTVRLRDLDMASLTVPRSDFCADLSPDLVGAALDGEPQSSDAYANGERGAIAAGVRDVAHEYSCTWKGGEKATARVWVFAPPVTADRAADLADAVDTGGCKPIDAPAYGDPSASVVCRTGPVRRAVRAGLFGDAWTVCSLTVGKSVPRAELEERSDAWCAGVLATAAAAAS